MISDNTSLNLIQGGSPNQFPWLLCMLSFFVRMCLFNPISHKNDAVGILFHSFKCSLIRIDMDL